MMKKISKITMTLLIIHACMGCSNSNSNNQHTEEQPLPVVAETERVDVSGNYVSDAYSTRNEGYDWVAVTVKQNTEDGVVISVRSRADKKKPTCTFDATAEKVDRDTYKTKNIMFRFKGDVLTIYPEKEQDAGLLNYYCSGGGSLAGDYKKIQEALDQQQIDTTSVR